MSPISEKPPYEKKQPEPKSHTPYPLGEPEKNPVFFEKRVYQGSNGKVYPVPFIDKVSDEKTDVIYQCALLENEYVRLEMLPEIGGRIFTGQDKTNGDYDFFYRQNVIKPALVGLAGPWISGGVEFNWPQHHRPGTYLPTDVHIEEEADGARTIWMSEHDPLNRLKGMHGIRLRPGSSLIELRARLYNRTPFVQTFLWWANVAAEVHDRYQSFFPQDVHYVADHAVRATSSFPIADNPYYGIDYRKRPGANDLGIAYWNHERDGAKAARAYGRAMELDPHDARLVSEADQLAAKRGVDAAERLGFLERHRGLVLQRDDATVALAELYNRTGRAQTALDLILSRRFHPWEASDFSAMEVVEHSPLSYYRGLSLQQLGRHEQAAALFDELKLFAGKQLRIPFEIDYFATSLPNLLVFDEDLQARHEADARHLIELATRQSPLWRPHPDKPTDVATKN